MKSALFPGSFDPVTLGHIDIVSRATSLFDSIIIGIGINNQKSGLFTIEQRVELLNKSFANYPSVKVQTYEGLTIDFAKKSGCGFLLRGLRNGMDLEYEKPVAALNKQVSGGIETFFLIASGAYSHISSTLVRELLRYGASPTGLVPEEITLDISRMLRV